MIRRTKNDNAVAPVAFSQTLIKENLPIHVVNVTDLRSIRSAKLKVWRNNLL